VRAPAVQRVAPVLAGVAEGVGRHAGHDQGPAARISRLRVLPSSVE
jgi:hypothetical protein